jgi:hypothetical protein
LVVVDGHLSTTFVRLPLILAPFRNYRLAQAAIRTHLMEAGCSAHRRTLEPPVECETIAPDPTLAPSRRLSCGACM